MSLSAASDAGARTFGMNECKDIDIASDRDNGVAVFTLHQ